MENRIPRVYTNQVGVNLSAYDLALIFFNKRNTDPSMNPEDVVAEVVMSPQHAKTLMLVLQQNVVDYERIFGTINIEPNKDAFVQVQAKVQSHVVAQAQEMEQIREQVEALTQAQEGEVIK